MHVTQTTLAPLKAPIERTIAKSTDEDVVKRRRYKFSSSLLSLPKLSTYDTLQHVWESSSPDGTQYWLSIPRAQAVPVPFVHTDGSNMTVEAKFEPSSSKDLERDEALAAWNGMFDERQVSLGHSDVVPFQATRHLGRGGGGSVDETKIGGVTVAWKRISTRARRLTNEEMNEVKILGEISKQRHKHVVELIGSYIHRYRGGIELGMLIWPVAHCDLAHFLQDIDYLGDSFIESETTNTSPEDLESVIENLSMLISGKMPDEAQAHDTTYRQDLYSEALDYLSQKFGCIGEAVAYLHHQGIRHKDLKPAQILLAADGLWLTDFGWSKDISQFTNSVTNGGHQITLKYHAPERAAGGFCGKPEDIFALGCIFLEIGYRCTRIEPEDRDSSLPWGKNPFHINLQKLVSWTAPFYVHGDRGMGYLGQLIIRMLSFDPRKRPTIDQVVKGLSFPLLPGFDNNFYPYRFFGDCCTPRFTAQIPHDISTSESDATLQAVVSDAVA